MARKGNLEFTRTVTSTTIKVIAIDVESCETFETECIIQGKIPQEKAVHVAAKAIDTDRVKVVKLIDTSVSTKLYGMSLETFIKNATEITKR